MIMKFSFYKSPIMNKIPQKSIELSDMKAMIQKDKYKQIVEKVRNAKTKEERNKIKKYIDYVTPGGEFELRSKNKIIKQSGYAPIDIDGIDNITELKEKLKKDKYVNLIFTSPSGNGLKLIIKIPIDINKYENYVISFYHYISKKYNISYKELDTATKDISRACFLSYDTEASYNKNAKIFDTIIESENVNEEKNNNDYRKDNSTSGMEYREVCKLLFRNKTKEEIFKHMNNFVGWSKKGKAYQEHTYTKAYNFINKKKEDINENLNEEQINKDVLKRLTDIKIYGGQELLDSDIPEPSWLIDHYLIKNGVTLIAGTDGAGKSLLALYLSLCLNNGKSLFSSEEWDKYEQLNTKKSKVLYFDEENNLPSVKSRLYQLKNSMNINVDSIMFSSMQNIVIDNDFDERVFIEIIKQHKPDVIVLDSLVRFFNGDENSANDMKKLFSVLKKCNSSYNTSSILLHHVNKTKKYGRIEKTDIRGSSDITAFPDVILGLNKIKTNEDNKIVEKVLIEPLKYRHEEKYKSFFFRIHKDDKDMLKLSYALDLATSNKIETEDLIERIIEYLKTEQVDDFPTKFILQKFEKTDGRNDVYGAIKKMVTRKYLKRLKKGHYEVGRLPEDSTE